MSLRYGSEAKHNFNTSASPATINAIVASAGNRVFIYRLIMTFSVAGTMVMQDTSGNNMSGTFQFGATGGLSLDVPFNLDPWWYTGQALLQGQASAQQGGLTGANLSGSIQQGQNLGVNFVCTGGTTVGWDVWWDYHP